MPETNQQKPLIGSKERPFNTRSSLPAPGPKELEDYLKSSDNPESNIVYTKESDTGKLIKYTRGEDGSWTASYKVR